MRSSAAILYQISPSVEEASISLGCSPMRTFFKVTAVMMLPKDDELYGDKASAGVYRSMLAEQFATQLSKAGGIGISNDVYRTLILQQANNAG